MHVRRETILVVDDEPVVLTLIQRLLEAGGYAVIAASGSREALQLSREHEIDAVVTDVSMPSMSGPRLVEELRRHRPRLPALFTSGFTKDAIAGLEASDAEVAFVQKPFSGEELVLGLRRLLLAG